MLPLTSWPGARSERRPEQRRMTRICPAAALPGGAWPARRGSDARPPGRSRGSALSPPAQVWTRITRELGPESGVALQPGPALQPDLSPEPGLGAEPGLSAERGPILSRAGGAAAGRGVPWWRRPVAAGAAGLLIGFGVTAGVRQLASAPGYNAVAGITLRPLPQFPQWKVAAGTAVMERGASGKLLSVTLRAPSRPGFNEVWLLARDGAR
jgi:hypothetical protein